MMGISMMGFTVEERTRKELNSTTLRGWTLSYIRDLQPVSSESSHFINVFCCEKKPVLCLLLKFTTSDLN